MKLSLSDILENVMVDILSESEDEELKEVPESDDQKKEKKPFPFKKNKKEEKEPVESSDDGASEEKNIPPAKEDSKEDSGDGGEEVRPADKYNKERFIPKPKKEEKKPEEPKEVDEKKTSGGEESSNLSSDQKLAAEVAAKTAAETAKAMSNGQPSVMERPDVPSIAPQPGTPDGLPVATGPELDAATLSSLGAGAGALDLRKKIRQLREM